MREKSLLLLNLLLFLSATYIACSFQIGTVLSQEIVFLQSLLPPLLWIPPILYICFYRKPFEGFLTVYLLTLAISPVTIQSFASLLIVTSTLFVVCQTLKTHFFWPSKRYFMLISFFAAVFFQIANSVLNFFSDSYLPPWSSVFTWPVQAVATGLSAFVYFYLLGFIDRVTDKPALTEASHEVAA